MAEINEQEVANNAKQKLQSALRSKTSGFKAHIQNAKTKSLNEATATANVKKYGKKKDGNQLFFMRSLSIKMERHGFIQNYGVKDRTRSGGSRTRTSPKDTTYNFRTHVFNMKAQPFINDAINESGVIPYVQENISAIRLTDIALYVKASLEEVPAQN
jgi:hypothetical protein